MQIEFLGTAGYHPSESRQTSCIYLPDAANDAAFVLDAGTGFARLVKRPLPRELHIFLSHPHIDHTMGITFLFDVLLNKECTVTLHAVPSVIEAIMQSLSNTALFPVELPLQVAPITGRTIVVCGVKIEIFPLKHPGGCHGYRFDWPGTVGKNLAYVTDTAGSGTYGPLIKNVDVLIHERNFSNDLQDLAKRSGHCTSEEAAQIAREVQAKKLILTHFNPLTPDSELDVDNLRAEFPDVIFASDHLVVDF